MKQKFLLLFLLIMVMAVVGGCTKKPEPEPVAVSVGAITGLEGVVEILKIRALDPQFAKMADAIFVGDRLRTRADGKVEITFVDSSVLRLAPGSSILIEEYLLEGKARKSGVVKLFQGKARAIIIMGEELRDAKFQIRTPTATISVRGTDFFVFHDTEKTGALAVEGKLAVFNNTIPKRITMLEKGLITSIKEAEYPTPPRAATEVETEKIVEETTIGYVPPPPPVKKKVKKEQVIKAEPPPPPPPPPVKKKIVKAPPPVPEVSIEDAIRKLQAKIAKEEELELEKQQTEILKKIRIVKAPPRSGRGIFKANCVACHGRSERSSGRLAPAKKNRWSKNAASRHVRKVLRGAQDSIPREYDKLSVEIPAYTDEEIIELEAYAERPYKTPYKPR